MPQPKPDQSSSPYAYPGLHRIVHERARLSVLTSLSVHLKGLRFGDLKQLSGLTDGNLSRHLQVLVASKLVEISKSFEGNRPQTSCKLTVLGRKCYADYVLELERVLRDAASAAKSSALKRCARPA